MMIERLHLPLSRPLVDFLQHNETLAALKSLFHAITHHEPEPDTSIAWEDGEAEEQPEVAPQRR